MIYELNEEIITVRIDANETDDRTDDLNEILSEIKSVELKEIKIDDNISEY